MWRLFLIYSVIVLAIVYGLLIVVPFLKYPLKKDDE